MRYVVGFSYSVMVDADDAQEAVAKAHDMPPTKDPKITVVRLSKLGDLGIALYPVDPAPDRP